MSKATIIGRGLAVLALVAPVFMGAAPAMAASPATSATSQWARDAVMPPVEAAWAAWVSTGIYVGQPSGWICGAGYCGYYLSPMQPWIDGVTYSP